MSERQLEINKPVPVYLREYGIRYYITFLYSIQIQQQRWRFPEYNIHIRYYITFLYSIQIQQQRWRFPECAERSASSIVYSIRPGHQQCVAHPKLAAVGFDEQMAA